MPDLSIYVQSVPPYTIYRHERVNFYNQRKPHIIEISEISTSHSTFTVLTEPYMYGSGRQVETGLSNPEGKQWTRGLQVHRGS